jgi:magnesium chelatase family protein
MSLACVYTRAQRGLAAPPVAVEVHLAGGLPGLVIVGLPEAAVRESRDRVRAAIVNAGFKFPRRRIIVNLAPADLPKQGSRVDLPNAVGILAASGQIPIDRLDRYEFLGELALSGALRPVSGLLTAALVCTRVGHDLVLPAGNATEARLCIGITAHCAKTLGDVCRWLCGAGELEEVQHDVPDDPASGTTGAPQPDLSEIRGQNVARRALEIAASGGHHLLLTGPPGTGKSMLASRLPGILPPLDDHEALEVAAIASVRGMSSGPGGWRQRPFRSPHHSASAVAISGGGSHPRPGEISLAHRGVLFLDELPEFDRRVLEGLREPLETGYIHVTRSAGRERFPAAFQLVAAMNPCPCGYSGDPRHACRCPASRVASYQARVSGPLLDRIDLRVQMPRLSALELADATAGESSATVKDRVTPTRKRQHDRQGALNARLRAPDMDRFCTLHRADRQFLITAITRLGESHRACHQVLRVARTLADMDQRKMLCRKDLLEALSLRRTNTNAS